jgi:Ran GTPase-activating protein (RanGAP) involved in mRNA processing and transport
MPPVPEPVKKFTSFRKMLQLKARLLPRKPDTYQNLKLEKRIAIYEPRSSIDLDRQFLTDQDMPIVVQQAVIDKQCTTLSLSNNRITSQGVSILAEVLHNNTTLAGLSIFSNRVGDEGVYSLAQALAENNSTLKALSLGWNGITDEGAEYLADILKTNRTLSELWLPCNQISDRGVKLLANALIQHNTSLKTLSLDADEGVNDSSVSYLIDMINQNQSLDVLHVCNCKLSKAGKARLREVAKSKTNFALHL